MLRLIKINLLFFGALYLSIEARSQSCDQFQQKKYQILGKEVYFSIDKENGFDTLRIRYDDPGEWNSSESSMTLNNIEKVVLQRPLFLYEELILSRKFDVKISKNDWSDLKYLKYIETAIGIYFHYEILCFFHENIGPKDILEIEKLNEKDRSYSNFLTAWDDFKSYSIQFGKWESQSYLSKDFLIQTREKIKERYKNSSPKKIKRTKIKDGDLLIDKKDNSLLAVHPLYEFHLGYAAQRSNELIRLFKLFRRNVYYLLGAENSFDLNMYISDKNPTKAFTSASGEHRIQFCGKKLTVIGGNIGLCLGTAIDFAIEHRKNCLNQVNKSKFEITLPVDAIYDIASFEDNKLYSVVGNKLKRDGWNHSHNYMSGMFETRVKLVNKKLPQSKQVKLEVYYDGLLKGTYGELDSEHLVVIKVLSDSLKQVRSNLIKGVPSSIFSYFR